MTEREEVFGSAGCGTLLRGWQDVEGSGACRAPASVALPPCGAGALALGSLPARRQWRRGWGSAPCLLAPNQCLLSSAPLNGRFSQSLLRHFQPIKPCSRRASRHSVMLIPEVGCRRRPVTALIQGACLRSALCRPVLLMALRWFACVRPRLKGSFKTGQMGRFKTGV